MLTAKPPKSTLISLVITCYNEVKNIEPLYHRVDKVFQSLPGYQVEMIYIDNDSQDGSYEVLKNLAKKNSRVKVIIMSRNTGSPQPSFLAGMSYARGEGVFLFHGDIQDPPELIPEYLTKWKEGYDVVYGIRTHRLGYGRMWNFYYKAFYYLLQKLAYIPIPLHAGEFSIMSRRVVDALLDFPERDYNVRCLRAFVGFKQIGIPYIREDRAGGKSTVNFWIALYSAEEMIVNFSFKPLWFVVFAGLGTFFLSAFLFVMNVFTIVVYHHNFFGISLGIILILFVLGMQFIGLGMISMYLAKMFLELKGRPRYIIGETMNIPKQFHHDYVLKRPEI